MNAKNFTQIGVPHIVQSKIQDYNVDQQDEITFDEIDNEQFDNHDNDNTENDFNNLICDTYYTVLSNNSALNVNYLSGSKVIISNDEKTTAINDEPIYAGSAITAHDLVLYLEFLKCTMKMGDINST